MISLNTLNHFRKKLLLWSSFYKWENCCLKGCVIGRRSHSSQIQSWAVNLCHLTIECALLRTLLAPCSDLGMGEKDTQEEFTGQRVESTRGWWVDGGGRLLLGLSGAAIRDLALSSMGKRRGVTRRSAPLPSLAFPLCPGKATGQLAGVWNSVVTRAVLNLAVYADAGRQDSIHWVAPRLKMGW